MDSANHNHDDLEGVPARAAPEAHRQNAVTSRLLLLAPLLACMGCLALAFASQRIYKSQLNAQPLPVTGEDSGSPDQTVPTLPHEDNPSPMPQREEPRPPILAYRFEVDRVLEACYHSFHQFYLFEEMMVSEPQMIESERWVVDAQNATDTFQDDCVGLGDLPSAPGYYAEVDHWLKLAAGEVAPAAESFARALGRRPAARTQREELRLVVGHMMKFLEYTHNAEAALSSTDERREI